MSELPLSFDSSPQLLDAAALRRAVLRLAHEIAERHDDLDVVVLVGIRTRGVPLAQRVACALEEIAGAAPVVAALDTRNHRDDRPRLATDAPPLAGVDGQPAPSIDERTVIVVDDVLFTGRTLRAALDALMSEGRPAAVEVLALIDRGHREIPVRANYVGKNVPTAPSDRVYVRLRDADGVDGAWLHRGVEA